MDKLHENLSFRLNQTNNNCNVQFFSTIKLNFMQIDSEFSELRSVLLLNLHLSHPLHLWLLAGALMYMKCFFMLNLQCNVAVSLIKMSPAAQDFEPCWFVPAMQPQLAVRDVQLLCTQKTVHGLEAFLQPSRSFAVPP